MALNKDKKCRIEEAIINGYTYEVISKDYKVSTKTVQRIKKGLAETMPELATQINDNKYNLKFGSRQAEKQEHLNELKRLYEDTEEGWIYDAAKEDYASREKSRTFAGIIYGLDDKGRQELALRLEAVGFSGEISPIHDHDIWEHDSPQVIDQETGEILEDTGSRYKSGDRKKAHTHIMIQIDKPVTYKAFNTRIHCLLPDTPLWIIVTSTKSYYNYMTHHTEAAMKAGKYLYDVDEIISFGEFEMTMTKADKQLIITMLAKEIIEEQICYLSELVKRHSHIPEEMGVIKDSSYFLKVLIDEQWKKANPEGRISRTKMQIVKNFEEEEE